MRKVHSSQELEKVDISDSFKQARASKKLVGYHFGIPVRLSKNDRGIDWVKLGSGLEVPLDEIERYNEDTVEVVAWDEELNKNDYDMEHITCYRTTGAEMQGENTLFKTLTRLIHLGFK